jgi:hypothetical protein
MALVYFLAILIILLLLTVVCLIIPTGFGTDNA